MRFTNDALDEFRAIYRDEFGEDITRDEAQEIGTRVVGLLRLLLRPLPGDTDRTRSAQPLTPPSVELP